MSIPPALKPKALWGSFCLTFTSGQKCELSCVWAAGVWVSSVVLTQSHICPMETHICSDHRRLASVEFVVMQRRQTPEGIPGWTGVSEKENNSPYLQASSSANCQQAFAQL